MHPPRLRSREEALGHIRQMEVPRAKRGECMRKARRRWRRTDMELAWNAS